MSSDRDRPPVPQALQSRHPTSAVIRQEIWNRLNKDNEHFQAVVVGREGKGKSGTALSICELADPNMSIEQVMFDPGQMLKKVNKWKQNGTTTGRMITADEAGVGLGNRTWHDKDQIRFAQVMQLIRSENMGILFTVPRGKEIDSQIRGGRLHGQFIIDEKHEADFTVAQYEIVNVGRRIDADWLTTPKPYVQDEQLRKRLETIRIGPPSDELWEEYLPIKQQFQSEEYQDAAEGMGVEMDDEDEVNELKQIAAQAADNLGPIVGADGRSGDPLIKKDLIRVEYDLSMPDANAVKSLLEKQIDQSELEEDI